MFKLGGWLIVVICSKDLSKTTESIVTVDWENGFVETSAKENLNITKVFKELLSQAKVI